ncbi:hypothetical protein C0J52_18759, partial [Blattella germanica]
FYDTGKKRSSAEFLSEAVAVPTVVVKEASPSPMDSHINIPTQLTDSGYLKLFRSKFIQLESQEATVAAMKHPLIPKLKLKGETYCECISLVLNENGPAMKIEY